MQINRNLLPIKLHYFLRYAGSTFLTMVLPLIVRQKGVSVQGIGFLWTTMPIVGLIASSLSGAMADYFRAHRTVFLLALAFLTTGLLTSYGLPNIPLDDEFQATNNVARGIDTLFPREDLQGVNPNSNNFTVPDEMNIFQSFQYPEKTGDISAPNATGPHLSEVFEGFHNMIDPELTMDEGQMPPPFSVDPKTDSSALSYLMKFPQFWFIFVAIMIEQMGLSTCVTISDAVCLQILGNERHKYGQQRLWGTIGMGILAVIIGALVDLYSKNLPQTDYLPAVINCVVVMTADMILVSKMKISSSQERKLKMADVGNVIVHPRTILFFVTVFVMGTSLGLLWVFKLMYMEDVSIAWNPNFENLKLLQGLDMGIETFGGEVPFFFLSGMIITRFGHNVVFASCLAALSLRCCLYYTISNPWWFLPVEFLNGISYALFHACMAAYASHLAPPGAQATLQALVRASFSVGLSAAGFLGGLLYQSTGGALMYLFVGIFDAAFCIVFICSQFLISKHCGPEKLEGQESSKPLQQEKIQAEEKGVRVSLIENV